MTDVTSNAHEFLWVTKYRPKTVDECILPQSIKNAAQGYVEQGRIPNMILSGNPGSGKTTLAIAMCEQVGADWLMINASSDNGIDTIRTKITQFASTVSFTDSKKVTILDEADAITAAAQSALRNFTETYSANHSIIMTCNYKHKLIEPLHSRCACIDFKIPNNEKAVIAGAFMKRVCKILEMESIDFDKKVVAEIIQRHFPDFRRVLNELQRYSVGGKIDSGILANHGDESFNTLISALRDKKFTDVRKWIAQNSDMESSEMYRMFYDKAQDKLESKTIPELILILADYQYKSAFVADPEINNMACMIEIMSRCAFKA